MIHIKCDFLVPTDPTEISVFTAADVYLLPEVAVYRLLPRERDGELLVYSCLERDRKK